MTEAQPAQPLEPALPRVPTGERAERKRKAIVRAAREIFVRDGFDAGMDLIAAEAGVSKMTVYNHFGSKDVLFLAVINDALEEALGPTLAGTQERLNSSDDLHDSLRWIARGWVEGLVHPDVLALRSLVVAESRRFPELGKAWRAKGPGPVNPLLAETFRRLVDEGRLVMPDVDLAIVQLYSLVLYPHYIHSAYGDRLDEAFTSSLIDSGVDMFLTHYQYQPAG
jgi:AcrR family transcriptional regulator